MKRVLDYFIENSVVVNLITLLIIIMGIVSIFSLNKETFPNVDFNFIIVRTAYPGAAAEDVEKLISIEIERQLKQVDGIEELNLLSSEGGSIASIKVDPDYDIDEVLIDVKDAVDSTQDLPEDAEDPIVTNITNKTRGLMKVGVYGGDEWELRAKAKALRDKLELDPRISRVELTGYRDEVFYVEAKLEDLKKYDMTLNDIVATIKDRQVNLSAGNIKKDEREKLVRTLVENETVKEIEDITIRSNDIGDVVKVKDVAHVARALKDATREDRADGKLAIFLSIQIKSSSDVLDSAKFIKKTLKEETQRLNLKYEIYDDFSFYVKRRLGILTQNGFQGIFLVIICLIFFLNFKVSIITALGAPFAFFVAFSLMDMFGITINLISMFGLIMVLGMLVDDSIIVAEQYYQNIEKGFKPKDAAKRAAYETLAPVSATIITTMVAFSALFFMEGIMGKFLWPVPAVVIIALLASWLECFFILPGHLADFAAKVKNIEKDTWYKPLLRVYEKHLNFCLKHAWKTIGVFVLMFIFSIITITTMKFELFPSDDITKAQVNIKGPVGTPFDKVRAELLKIEDIIFKTVQDGELEGVQTITGFQQFKGGRSKTGTHYGSIAIELTMQDQRERSTNDILSLIAEESKKVIDPKFSFNLEKFKNGPPTGKPINIELYGDSLEELESLALSIKEDVLKFKGVISAELDYEEGKKQIIVKIDEDEARRLGVTNLQVARELRASFEGLEATTIKKSDEDVDIVVRLNEASRKTEDTLKSIEIKNQQGRNVKLSQIANFSEEQGAFVIRRLNRKRTVAIVGEVDTKLTTSVAINKQLTPYLDKKLKGVHHISYRLAGENEDTKESLEGFQKGLVASIFIIFIILVILFSSLAQPIIIMTAIPFGLIGVVISFKIFGLAIGFMALMGMLGLVGVVINDSIVLVTFINRTLLEEGEGVKSIVKASVSRFRAVILTTFTTVVGLLPVAHAPGGDPFLKPMATSFAYGLLFSSAITLILVPSIFKVVEDLKQRFSKKPVQV
jgi:multidrug efflux pump subunit AcrB